MDNPRMRKYTDRVEKKLTELRASGQNAPREAIYLFMLGEDVNKATTVKPKPAAATPAPGALPAAARGQPARARSDVNAKGAQSESAKRRARLENQLI